MKKCFYISALLTLCTQSLWAQEFAYVTDSLQLRVYSKPSAESEQLQTIDSGDSVEVFVTQDGFSRVSTYDGTEGWVKSAFLVDEPPEKLLYFSVSEKNKELELEALKNDLQNNTTDSSVDSVTQIKELNTALEQQQQTNLALQQQVEEKSAMSVGQTMLASKRSLVDEQKTQTQILASKNLWLFGFAAVLLFAGILLGVKLSSWRMKKRLHGFRFS
jgi:SH3 domain protein